MAIEDAYTLVNAIHQQVTGNTSLTATDLSSFISVAQATLQAGYDPVMSAISQVLTRTIFAVRPYERHFKGLEVTSDRWGGIIRKISFDDSAAESEETYALTDNTSYDQYVVKNPKALETHYVGSDGWVGKYTIYTKQLDEAFQNPESFGAFMTALLDHFANQREQWLEGMSRTALINFMAAKVDANDTASIVNLLTEYNTATGLTLTGTTVRQPANFPAFIKWAVARVEQISALMTERSSLYQLPITGFDINRHTPREFQKVYINNDFKVHMDAEVLTDAYHDNYIKLTDYEGVNFWQAIGSPLDINAKPVYIDSAGAVKVASAAVSVSSIIGVMFDRDAVGLNIFDNSLAYTPYNARGQYYNLYAHSRVQFQNDLTEKFVLLKLA